MSSKLIPIRDDVRIESDAARELIDFCVTQIVEYQRNHGWPPTSIAMVLSGSDGERRATEPYSWDQSETRTKLETCSIAAALLTKRAIDA